MVLSATSSRSNVLNAEKVEKPEEILLEWVCLYGINKRKNIKIEKLYRKKIKKKKGNFYLINFFFFF